MKQMEERSKALKLRKEQFYNNFATVLHEKYLMRLIMNEKEK